MTERGFLGLFHKAWGLDSEENKPKGTYSKKAWMYVQSRIEEGYKKQIFWDIFNEVWDRDKEENQNKGTYDEQAWLYVQVRARQYLIEGVARPSAFTVH